MSSNFIHLHAHSEYSLDNGFFSIDDYIKFCYENNVSAAAYTERFNLFSAIKFYRRCFDFGIKPIIGCEFFLEHNCKSTSRILLLCQSITGYRNLTKLIAKAYSENIINGIPVIKRKWLVYLSKDLIIIGLSFESDIGIFLLNDDYSSAVECLKFWNKVCHNSYYLSVTNFGLFAESLFIERVFDFVNDNDVLLVATNEVCFLRPVDFMSYKSKLAIFDTEKRVILDVSDSYFKNRYFKLDDEMLSTFYNMSELLYNSVEISKRCNLLFKFENDYSPKFLKRVGYAPAAYLSKSSYEQLFDNLNHMDKKQWSVYINRLDMELSVINNVGFANYFLITQDFILWARKQDIFVGPGRGSGAGSLVAYILSITEIDPIKYNLLFERFLNSERISRPDFDVDFCIEGRDLVIDYVFEEYGIKNVAQIITFGCMTIKAVIRDIGRVLGYSYLFVDRFVKLISNDFGVSLKSELISNLGLKKEYDNSYDVQTIINLGLKLEGLIKGIGRHAGGLIISPFDLSGYLPLCYESDEFHFMTQFDKNDAELFGFVKFDFLGLKTLSIISTVIDGILTYKGMRYISSFDTKNIKLCDNRTFSLLQDADTIGIFQFESVGMKSVIQKMKPDLFMDIVALVALYRPGPLQSGMLHSFINRKLGLEKIDYIHDRLEKVLGETYGMLVYQEQVMLIAQVFSNYSIAPADFLRIAMSKKNVEDMAIHLEIFIRGAALNGIDRTTAENVFHLVGKFAGYGFNKAHSVGYALLSYHSAWLKANYNSIFMSSLLSSDMDNYDDILSYINECRHFSIEVFAPDINRSFYCFTMWGKNIRYGFGSIKGIGLSVISEIIHNRSIFGAYSCFFDFLYRVNLNLFSKKTLQSLIYSGVFDKLNSQRFKLILISSKVFDLYFSFKNVSLYIMTSIDNYFDYMVRDFSYMMAYKQREIRQERDLLCNCIFNDSLSVYEYESSLISKLSFKSGKYFNIFFAGLIKKIHFKNILYEKHAILNIVGCLKSYELVLPYIRYQMLKKIIKKDSFIVAAGYMNKGFFCELFIDDFYLFRYKFVKYMDFVLNDSFISNVFLKKFCFLLSSKFISGNTIIRIKICIRGKYHYILFHKSFKVALHDDIISCVSKFMEVKRVEFVYSF